MNSGFYREIFRIQYINVDTCINKKNIQRKEKCIQTNTDKRRIHKLLFYIAVDSGGYGQFKSTSSAGKSG